MNTTAVATRPRDKSAVIEAELTRLAPKIMAQLPNGMSAERFQTVTLQAVAKNPDLLDCTPSSVILAVLEAASVGLEPTGVLGQAYLVPYKDKAQLQIGYNGYRTLARRSGEISSIEARVVYEGDRFEVHYGTEQRIVHDPTFQNDPGKITHAYCVSRLKDGTIMFDVMTRTEIDGIRARSKSANRGPWVTDYAEMARKTVIRRHVKALPMTVEAAHLIDRDDEAEFGRPEPAAAVSRTATVREALAARNEPAQDAPGAPEEPEVAPAPTPTPERPPDPEADWCGVNPPIDGLAMTERCAKAVGHKGAHESSEGSWPATATP
ncbi:MAG TPA: recombinase RecT [Actinomycetes bacterium]|nr:recombinase RecT [Actinomycetes bacterium]